MNKTLIFMSTHFIDEAVISEYKKMRDTPNVDAILAIDNNAYKYDFQNRVEDKIFYGVNVKCFFFDSKLRDEMKLPYFTDSGKTDFASSEWYNSDYRFYYVRKIFPDYEYYWQIEYDVFCNAPTYEGFLKKFADDDSDLLIEKFSLGQKAGENRWDYNLDWVYKNYSIYGGFFPVVRLSARAADFLYKRRLEHKEIYNYAGDWVFCELFVPTELMNKNFSCKNLNEPNIHFENIYLNDNRIFLTPDNKLYHPVKSARAEIDKLKLSLRKNFFEKLIGLSFGINIVNLKMLPIHFNEDFTFAAIPIPMKKIDNPELYYTVQFLGKWILIALHCEGRFANVDIRRFMNNGNFKGFGFLKNDKGITIIKDIPENFDDVQSAVDVLKKLIYCARSIIEENLR